MSDYPYPFNTGYHLEKEYQRWREDYQRANGYMGWPFLTLRRWALWFYEKIARVAEWHTHPV